MITVLGILSAVAIPRFSSITTSANTAKVQADLSTLDTAIALYQMDNGTAPKSKTELKTYVQDADELSPPKGDIYIIEGTGTLNLSGTADEYGFKTSDGETRAAVKETYTSDKIGKKKSD